MLEKVGIQRMEQKKHEEKRLAAKEQAQAAKQAEAAKGIVAVYFMRVEWENFTGS